MPIAIGKSQTITFGLYQHYLQILLARDWQDNLVDVSPILRPIETLPAGDSYADNEWTAVGQKGRKLKYQNGVPHWFSFQAGSYIIAEPACCHHRLIQAQLSSAQRQHLWTLKDQSHHQQISRFWNL